MVRVHIEISDSYFFRSIGPADGLSHVFRNVKKSLVFNIYDLWSWQPSSKLLSSRNSWDRSCPRYHFAKTLEIWSWKIQGQIVFRSSSISQIYFISCIIVIFFEKSLHLVTPCFLASSCLCTNTLISDGRVSKDNDVHSLNWGIARQLLQTSTNSFSIIASLKKILPCEEIDLVVLSVWRKKPFNIIILNSFLAARISSNEPTYFSTIVTIIVFLIFCDGWLEADLSSWLCFFDALLFNSRIAFIILLNVAISIGRFGVLAESTLTVEIYKARTSI